MDFKHSAKEIGFHLLLLVGICTLFAMFYSTPRAFNLRNLWKIEEPSEKHSNATTTSRESDADKIENNNKTNKNLGREQKFNQTFNVVTVETSAQSVKQSKGNGTEDDEKIGDALPSKPVCDFSDSRSDICNIIGDIRTKGYNSSTIYFIPSIQTLVPKEQEWTFNPYSRKMYTYLLNLVTVKLLRNTHDAPSCSVNMKIPAILLSMGGPSHNGNIYHTFTDVLIPLFLASKTSNGEVQFLVSSYNRGIINKYNMIFKNLSRYEIINFDVDKEVRCYPHMTVGLLNHHDLSIDPDRAFDRFDFFRFRLYVRNIYSLPMDVEIPYKMDPKREKKPRLMLILRSKTRKLLNQKEVAEIISKNGFEFMPMELKTTDNASEVAKLVDSCDVIMGVHGAGLTNMLYLRTNAVIIQVIPLGGYSMQHAAYIYYDQPAHDMKLRTLNYTITIEESSLLDKYGRDHPALKDPEAVSRKGWQHRQRYYWFEQDVRLNVSRFEPVLVKALQLLKE